MRPAEHGRPGPVPSRASALLLAWGASLAAYSTWSGMVPEPRSFLVPVGVGGLLLLLTGSALGRLRVAAPVVVLAQLLVAVLTLTVVHTRSEAVLGLVPTPGSLGRLRDLLVLGGQALGYYRAPVEVYPTATAALLTAGGLLLMWVVAALVQGLDRPALTALPLLVTVSVPVTILQDALSWAVFAVCAAAYLMLLLVDRTRHWARGASTGPAAAPASSPGAVVAAPVIVGSLLSAVLLAPLVPVADESLRPGGDGGVGTGTGPTVRLTTVNPFVSLRRDLLEQDGTPMLLARTEDPDPTYLRTTVLDLFTDQGWSASRRELAPQRTADGAFPSPEGLAAGTGLTEARWQLQLEPGFATQWLPLPTPVREVSVEGSWRYDDRFLDVALTSGAAEPGLRYEAIGLTAELSAQRLDSALAPPASVAETFTDVPADLPPVIVERAEEVTAAAGTPYQRAVALQDWFRRDGGFRYELGSRPGSGLDLLADFVTDDRVGYCEQFAAAMAAMGRSLGIPSRVAVGFLRPEELPGGELRFTSDDRHAWVEMYFRGSGWVRFEPTPAQVSGESPAYTRQTPDEPEAQAPAAPAPPVSEPLPDRESPDTASPGPAVSAGGGLLLVLVVSALTGVALGPTLLRRRQRRRRLRHAAVEDLAEGAWAEVRASAIDHGLPWEDRTTVRRQAAQLRDQVAIADRADLPGTEEAESGLRDLVELLEERRYAPAATLAVAVRADPRAVLATCERWCGLIAQRAQERPVPELARWERRWSPPSLRRPGPR